MRSDRGRLLAALIGDLRNFDLAEDCLSEAVESALVHWSRAGTPDRPFAWLLRVARRKAIDRLRRNRRWAERGPDLMLLAQADDAETGDQMPEIRDDRLRLIFTCCHPALDQKSRVALTLRTLGGLTTAEIARAFLDSEATMGQRLSRAKSKITVAGIPYRVPDGDELPERLHAVLAVIYLIFNEGYAASSGDAQVRVTLCDEAIWLARMLHGLTPDEPEVAGLLSLLLTTDARRVARCDAAGALVPLDRQDRGQWDRARLSEGIRLIAAASGQGRTGPYQIKAAIGALLVDCDSPASTDWPQILALYDALFRYEPSPVVALNRAVARAEAGDPQAALAEVDDLAAVLDDYQPYHAARADLLVRTGWSSLAVQAYDRAIALSGTTAEQTFLTARRDRLLRQTPH